MTNKEIRHRAYTLLRDRWDSVSVLCLYEAALIFAFAACDVIVMALCRFLNVEYYIAPRRLLDSPMSIFMVILRVLLIFFALLPEIFLVRRIYIDIITGHDQFSTRRYIMYNSRMIHPRATLSCFVPVMLKFFASVPLGIGVYGIYYFGYLKQSETLSTISLFCFTLSLALTVVWSGLLVHYCISLSLVKYIMALNPRANIFDACDLSVRLMEGHHGRYLQLMLSFVKYLPLLVLIYPLFIFVPFYRASMGVLAREIMGDYWQDKMPAMIQRWNKYAR